MNSTDRAINKTEQSWNNYYLGINGMKLCNLRFLCMERSNTNDGRETSRTVMRESNRIIKDKNIEQALVAPTPQLDTLW